jgi:hypothetical protein
MFRARGANVVFGLALLPLSIMLLFWNEGRSVQTARSLAEGAHAVLSVQAARVDPANDRRLIHVAGDLRVTGELSDPDFAVAAPALRLVRTVEMYQWREVARGGSGRSTSYEIVREWSADPIDTAQFHVRGTGQVNPPMRWRSRQHLAASAQLGAFRVGDFLLSELPANDRLALPQNHATALAGRFDPPAQAVDGVIYLSRNPAAPEIGDYRIAFTVARPQPVSVIAQQTGDMFAPFQTQAGDRLAMIRPGTAPAGQMFRIAEEQNVFMTWLLRVVGCAMQFFGWLLILRAANIVSFVPLLGPLVDAGAGLVAFALTALIALPTIALAWLWARPLLALGILAVGVAIAYGAFTTLRRRVPAGVVQSAR